MDNACTIFVSSAPLFGWTPRGFASICLKWEHVWTTRVPVLFPVCYYVAESHVVLHHYLFKGNMFGQHVYHFCFQCAIIWLSGPWICIIIFPRGTCLDESVPFLFPVRHNLVERPVDLHHYFSKGNMFGQSVYHVCFQCAIIWLSGP